MAAGAAHDCPLGRVEQPIAKKYEIILCKCCTFQKKNNKRVEIDFDENNSLVCVSNQEPNFSLLLLCFSLNLSCGLLFTMMK
jgi:hypothetical protein